MKLKEALEAKIPTTKTNKKKLSEIPDGEKRPDTSLLKKNEFALILTGALLVTLIIFFFFSGLLIRIPTPYLKIRLFHRHLILRAGWKNWNRPFRGLKVQHPRKRGKAERECGD